MILLIIIITKFKFNYNNGLTMNINIDSFYYSTYKLAKQLQENDSASLLTKLTERDSKIKNETDAIKYIGKFLSQKALASNRKIKSVMLPQEIIRHGDQLTRLAASVDTLKKHYLVRYSSSNARHLFQKISFFFKRRQMEKVANQVTGLINRFCNEDRIAPVVIRPQGQDLDGTLVINQYIVAPPHLLKKKDELQIDGVIGLNPEEMELIFANQAEGNVPNKAEEKFVKINTQTYLCKPLAGVKKGTVALTDAQFRAVLPILANDSKPAHMPVSLFVVPIRTPNPYKVIVKISHMQEKPLCYESTEEVKKLIKEKLLEHPVLIKGQTYVDMDSKISFSIDELYSLGEKIDERIGLLTDRTKISLQIGEQSNPFVFTDKIIKQAADTTFHFNVTVADSASLKKPLEIDENKLKEQFLAAMQKGEDGEDFIAFKKPKQILLTIDKRKVEIQLDSVKVGNKTFDYFRDDHDLYYFFYSEASQFEFTSLSSKIKMIKSKSSSQPESMEMNSVKGGKKEIELKEEAIKDKPQNLTEFLIEKGMVGLPDDLERILAPIVASQGPLAQLVKDRNLQSEKGILLYGPPGTGKTSFARVLAEYLGCPNERLQMISATELLTKWVGETEEKIRELFAPARKAAAENKENPPLYIIVIDELDSILSKRDDAAREHEVANVNQFLTELDGLHQINNILVIGMTNNLSKLDPAVIRPGRLGAKIEIALPKEQQRIQIFNLYLKDEQKHLDKKVNVQTLAKLTEGYSGADIKGVVESAKVMAFNRLQQLYNKEDFSAEELERHPDGQITMQDFEKAMKEVKVQK